jgi:hypothetical protein
VIQGSVPLVCPDEWVSVAVGSDPGISATVPERGEKRMLFLHAMSRAMQITKDASWWPKGKAAREAAS